MQARFSPIIRLLILFLVGTSMSSCFKEMNELDTLNTNMFDRNYQGDAWYDVDTVYSYVTDLGNYRTRFEVSLRQDRLPELKPSNIQLAFSTGGSDTIISNFPLQSGGIYSKSINLNYTGPGEYCIRLGVYVPEDSTVINSYESCASL